MIFFFLAMPGTCRSYQARDRTCATAATWGHCHGSSYHDFLDCFCAFPLPVNFRINLPCSIKYPVDILIGILLNLQLNLSLIQEHYVVFIYFCLLLISFNKVYSFSIKILNVLASLVICIL